MKDEPVQNGAFLHFVAGVLAMLANKYLPALGLSEEQAFALAVAVYGAIATFLARRARAKVLPMAKIADKPELHAMVMAALKRPS